MYKRIFSLCFAFLLLIGFVLHLPQVDAVVYNPSDYIIDSYYEGTEQFVTVKLPISSTSVNHSFYSHGVWEYSKPGYSVEFTVNQGFGYDVYFTFSHLNISDFPDSTVLEVEVYLDLFDNTVNPDHMTGVSMQPWVQFYDHNLKWVSAMKTYPTDNVNLNGLTKLTTLLKKDTNTASVGVKVSGFSTDHVPLGTEVVLSMTSLKLTMSMSALVEFQKGQDRTNELLDQLVNAEPQPVPPAGSGAVGNIGSIESGLLDSTASGRLEIIDINESSFNFINRLFPAFVSFGFVFDCFASSSYLAPLLTISLGLGVFALIVNLGIQASRSNGSAKSSKRGKGG